MKEFNLSSGTNVTVNEKVITIDRTGGRSALKGFFGGRAMGLMVIKLSSVTGLIFFADYLMICASGLPTPTDFKISSIAEVKQYPNCIVAKEQELAGLYSYIESLMS